MTPYADFQVLQLAARNIIREANVSPANTVLIVCSRGKLDIAELIAHELEASEIEYHLLRLGDKLTLATDHFQSFIYDVAKRWGLILLLQPEHAAFLFDTVGRPDRGIKIATDHLFSDWLIRPASLIRTYGIRREELYSFQKALISVLAAGKWVRILTKPGTEITLQPRQWHVTHGEIFTAPVEGDTTGVIYVDGCAYGGPPAMPFILKIERGQVVNLSDLSESDEQQRWVYTDLTRDANASILAEFGMGINPGARWDEDLMEAEQARGTCHFGFGHNIEYGGENVSSVHLDLVVRNATIEVDGKCICKDGEYQF